MFQRKVLQKLFGRNTRPVFKHALKMERAYMHVFSHSFERRLLPEIMPVKINSFSYSVIIYFFLLFHKLNLIPQISRKMPGNKTRFLRCFTRQIDLYTQLKQWLP